MTLAITGRGVDFVQMHKTLVDIIGGARTPHETDVVSGPAQLMPLAIDPADLAKLKVGQELDNDPVTKAVVKVTFAGRDSRGQDVVILTEAIPGNNQQQTEFAYDRATGLVVSMAQTNPYLHLVSQLSLTTKE
jgi:hypothetical protein